jgi:hypothetical protein
LFNSATFVDDTVVYPQAQWDDIREVFTKIIALCVEKK